MNKIINNLVNHLSEKPKTLFLLDSLGAFFTAFILFIVVRNLNHYFGMPETVLTYLSVIASIFCFYSAVCFLFLKENWIVSIRIISIANLLYCSLTTGLVIKYLPSLTKLGTGYFLLEIMIIAFLGLIEIKVARAVKI